MAISNRGRVDSGLNVLRDGLIPYVERHLLNHFGNNWDEIIDDRRRFPLDRDDDGNIRWDSQALLKVMWDVWNEVFRDALGHFERSLVSELQDVRNRHAHEEPFNSDDTYRALDSIQRLLQSVAANKQAEEIGKMKMALQRTVYAEQARNQTRYSAAVEGSPTSSLKPWREVIVPHPDVASGQYQQAEFAADLSQVARGEATTEYQDPIEFFKRTFITSGLGDLLRDALLRLSGKGGEPVVELQTNFGGGKTHSMLALFHLFGEARTTVLPGMEDILKDVELDYAPEASRAVLVGTALSPGEVVTKPDGTEVRTLWGEMAWQLAGKDGYEMVADSDRKGISPGSEILSELFSAAAPCIVLIDEWVAYARQTVGKHDIASGDFESQASFAQALTEAARAADQTLVVATLPASRIEIGGEHGEFALEALKDVFKRLGKPWRPATAEEGFEIVRRRLFEPIIDRDDFAARDAVVDAFSRMYQSSQSDFPSECKEGEYRRKIELAYPFHPELFDRLYGEWSTLDKFQRTRGVLRLLAKVIHRLWSSRDGSLLIMPASIPMDDNAVKSELTQFLEDVWEPIISSDVDGPNSLPYDLDGENASTLGRYSACRRVTRTLYIGTAPGSKGSNPGINDKQIRLGCVQPGEATATFGDALRRITDRATHIHHDGNRYWISTKANLNTLADDRTDELLRQTEELHAEIVQRIRKDQSRGEFAAVHRCPATTSDVQDDPETRLVIFGPEFPHPRGKTESAAIKQAKNVLETRGNSPRLLRNMVVFLAADKKSLEDLLLATAQYLAWKSINDEKEELNLDAYGRRQASTNMNSTNEAVDLRILETWVHAIVPIQPDPAKEIEWQVIRANGNNPLARRTATKLVHEELLMPVMGGARLRMEIDRYLWNDKNHIAFKDLLDYFARYIYLSRIRNRATLERAVQDGIARTVIDDTFAVADRYDESSNRYTGLRYGQECVLQNDTLIVKPGVAAAQFDQERQERESQGEGDKDRKDTSGGSGDSSGHQEGSDGGTGSGSHASKPSVFIGSVKLNSDRIGRDAGRVTEEVIQHLATLPGAEVEVGLEIRVRIPNGINENIIRIVAENSNTLGFDVSHFEDE